ncbi:MAG: serine/threonine-protein kinase [Gemmatimonadota bacterium]
MHAVTGGQRVVAGRYLLQDRIGRGAMGTVWRARDPVLARDVAVKEVQVPGLLTAQEREVLEQRTLREARAAARLNHPGVVTVFDVVEVGGNPWIVMELVHARSLEQILATAGPLPPPEAAEVGAMVLEALACAHAAGIMHRDVKPSNVLLSDEGRAVLTDFGIATLEGDPGLTQVGMVMGTPGFSAPERIRGDPATPASDLWSLGATLFAAVEGHGPFANRSTPIAVLAAVANEEAPPARSAGPLGPLIAALLRRDPGQRPDLTAARRMLAAAARPGAAAAQASPAVPASPAMPAGRVNRAVPAAGLLSAPPAAAPAGAPAPPRPAPASPAPPPGQPPWHPGAGSGPPGGSRRAAGGRPGPVLAAIGAPAGQHARPPAAGRAGAAAGRRRRSQLPLGMPWGLPWPLLAAGAALVTGAGLLIGFLAARLG